jgi:hypothetical protein
MKAFFSWLKSAYSESDGSGSSTRIHMTALIAFVIGIGVAFGVATHQKKFTIEQFDGFLGASATFIVTTCGPLYGLNKASDVLNKRNTSDNGTPNPTGV